MNRLDFCSGDGNLFNWMQKRNLPFKEYIGIDFSVDNKRIATNANIFKNNIITFDTSNYENAIGFIINGLCYLNNKELKTFLGNINNVDKLIIIDPLPGIFWDSFFENIKLYYRSQRKIRRIMKEQGYILKFSAIDYTIKIGELYIQKLSCGYHFEKNK